MPRMKIVTPNDDDSNERNYDCNTILTVREKNPRITNRKEST